MPDFMIYDINIRFAATNDETAQAYFDAIVPAPIEAIPAGESISHRSSTLIRPSTIDGGVVNAPFTVEAS